MEYKNLPDITGMAALRATVEYGGVSEAGRVLNIGQPAVTKRLRALERVYGLELMERVGGRLRLTEAGEKVYLLAVQTLDRHHALWEDMQKQTQGGQTSLRLEVTFAIGEHFLPEQLVRFSDMYPQYHVESRLAYSRNIQAHLATGATDLALMEGAPEHPDILVQKWADDELWLICGASHPLVGSGLLPVEQMAELTYVLREKHSSIRGSLDEALQGIGIGSVNSIMEVGSTDAIIDILQRGRHVSFLPRFAVEQDVVAGTLYHLKVTGFRIMRTLWIARHRNNLDHPVADAFIDMVRHDI